IGDERASSLDIAHDQIRIHRTNGFANGIGEEFGVAHRADFKIEEIRFVKRGAGKGRVHAAADGIPHAMIVDIAGNADDFVRRLIGVGGILKKYFVAEGIAPGKVKVCESLVDYGDMGGGGEILLGDVAAEDNRDADSMEIIGANFIVGGLVVEVIAQGQAIDADAV